MQSSWKCSECGLVNFAAASHCKRCNATAPAASALEPQAPAGITLGDGYVLPPPPATGGIWRDGKVLVMTKDAFLPDRCVRCNAPANGVRLRKRLRWHHPLLYLLIFGAMLIYLILAMVLTKRATVDFGLCAAHVQKRRNLILAAWGFFIFSVALLIVAIYYEITIIGLLSPLFILAAIVWLAIAYRIATVKRIDDRFIWFTGVNEHYLEQFPPLPSGLTTA